MSKCKFCKNQAFIGIRKYGYHEFGVCEDCFLWVLNEMSYMEEKQDEN